MRTMPTFSLQAAWLGATSGAIAVVPNELTLKAADLVAVPTAHGGLLALVKMLGKSIFNEAHASVLWNASIAPLTVNPLFQVFFHVVVAILMGVAYGALVEPFTKARWWMKGLAYGIAVWLANAFVVLPLTGEGIVGLRNISAGGTLWFAAAHFAFFIILAWVNRALKAAPARNSTSAL
jgi:hypothetical protein